MYLIDSSVWIALFLDDDTNHTKAVAVMGDIADAPIIVPYGVVIESATVLARKHSKEQANKFVEYVRDNPQIELAPPHIPEDLIIFLGESERLSFVDALLKGICLRDGLTLISFDKQLLRSLTRA